MKPLKKRWIITHFYDVTSLIFEIFSIYELIFLNSQISWMHLPNPTKIVFKIIPKKSLKSRTI